MSNENQKLDNDLKVEQMDPAQQQLAGALRASFRLLSFIMVLVLIMFTVSGITSVGPNEVGIVYRFGRIQDEVVEEGLAYAWPFMIGRVEKLDTSQQEIVINDFWMFESPEDRTKTLAQRKAPEEGLRPGYDGALLTGDQSLYHVRLRCGYQIRSRNDALDAKIHPAIQYKLNVTDAPEMVRSAICGAAIRTAAQRTMNDIHSHRGQFALEVTELAQEQLDALDSSLRIVNVSVTDATWPLQTLAAFAAADAAQNRNQTVINEAKGRAGEILQNVAGRNFEYLVGDPIQRKPQNSKDKDAKKPYDLIGQYAKARMIGDGGDNKQSEAILKQINDVLSGTEGASQKIIARADTESKNFVQAAQKRATRFTELLPKYKENPEFMLAAEWAKVLSIIFASPTVEIVVVGEGNRKIVLQTKQNPETTTRIRRELAKIKDGENHQDQK